MALKNTVCTTVDKAQPAKVDPNTGVAHPAGFCPGQYIRHEAGEGGQVTVSGKVYFVWEQCQRCGNIIPG